MWQRIQTLYLAIATILVASMFFCNFATILGPEGSTETLKYVEYGKFKPFLLFLIMLIAANGIALASFKVRMLQMRVCILAAILLIAFQAWIGILVLQHKEEMVFSFTAVFPLVAAILDILAARNIFIDEAIVHAASHLRGSRKKRK